MNRRQSLFLRQLGRTASIIADHIDGSGEKSGEEIIADAIWKSMYYFCKEVRGELSGMLKGSATKDCFEVSDWFEDMRRKYGKCSDILTFCQILCCIFRTGRASEGSIALRLLSRAVSLAGDGGIASDMIPVWQYMIKNKAAFFSCSDNGCDFGNDDRNYDRNDEKNDDKNDDRRDDRIVFGRMLLSLCCCAGNDKRYKNQMKMMYFFINAYAAAPDERERILEAVHAGALKGDTRLFSTLEAAYG